MPKTIRVMVAQRVVPEYRVPFFRRLHQLDGCSVLVVYGKPHGSFSVKNATAMSGFDSRMVKTIYLGRGILCLQPAVPVDLIRRKSDVIIAEFSLRIATNVLAGLLAPLFGVKFVWWGSGYEPQAGTDSMAYGVKKWITRFLLQRANGLLVYSEAAKRYYQGLGYDPAKIFIAYNSIDHETLFKIREYLRAKPEEVDEVRKRHRLFGKVPILFVGRLVRGKNVEMLLEAFSIVKKGCPGAALIIVGGGPLEPNLKGKVGGCDEDVKFVGSIYDKELLGKYFALARVFVLPGLGGLAINEAMCFGVPVVCTGADGTELQLVQDKISGFIVREASAESLAQAILRIITDEPLRKKMGQQAIRTIEDKVNMSTMVHGFRQAIEYVSRGPSSSVAHG
jgi:glycosyltransferase involved in cell wall biosynthesis